MCVEWTKWRISARGRVPFAFFNVFFIDFFEVVWSFIFHQYQNFVRIALHFMRFRAQEVFLMDGLVIMKGALLPKSSNKTCFYVFFCVLYAFVAIFLFFSIFRKFKNFECFSIFWHGNLHFKLLAFDLECLGARRAYLLGLLAMIKCSICSYQCEN